MTPFGRPRIFKSPDEVLAVFNEYLAYCKAFTVFSVSNRGDVVEVPKPRVPTLGGFCNWANIDTDSLLNYEKGEGYEDFFGTIKNIKQHILSGKLDALTNGEGSTTGLIFDLKANHGLMDKNQTELNISQIAVSVVPSPSSLASDESQIKD
jgi:hypothetical protein